MNSEMFGILLIPFAGTALGSACVFFMKNELSLNMRKGLNGFASGVMIAASIWSLIVPALEQSEKLGSLQFLPAVIGFWLGALFLMLLDKITPHLHPNGECEGPHCSLGKMSMLVLAVVIHNIPEGMAVGMVYAGYFAGSDSISLGGVVAMAVGIAIQNFPEGAIVSMPLKSAGKSRAKAFVNGALSGAVEPLGALLTIWAAHVLLPLMPYLLSFAAGAMMYVVVEELIPEMAEGEHSHAGVFSFALGFTLMLALDVALG